MKIKSVAAICRKDKMIILREENRSGEIIQYIGDGQAAYQVNGLSELDMESVFTIFDVPEKDRAKYHTVRGAFPAGIKADDWCPEEKQVHEPKLTISHGGKDWIPLETPEGMVFIESRYLAPLSDSRQDLSLFARKAEDGSAYIVAKAGLLLQAIIIPANIVTDEMVEALGCLYWKCKEVLQHPDREEPAQMEPMEQTALTVDPETGEVLG